MAPSLLRERHFDMLVEVRQAATPPFAEYNPNEMMIHVQLWDVETAAPADRTLSVVVPGEQSATVGDLRAAVATAFGINAHADKFWLVCPTAGSSKLDVLVLGDNYANDSKDEAVEGSGEEEEALLLRRANSMQQLCRDHKVWSGEKFYFERGGGAINDSEEGNGLSACAVRYEREAYIVTVVFNALETPGEYDRTLAVDLRSTVLEAKERIAEVLVRFRPLRFRLLHGLAWPIADVVWCDAIVAGVGGCRFPSASRRALPDDQGGRWLLTGPRAE